MSVNFVKKFVEKASKKHLGLELGGSPGGLGEGIHSLRVEDVNPRLIFHYGIPAGGTMLAYDSVQHIVALATKDGRIKLLGRDNTQALLQSESTVPSKFLQFFDNQGILLNITIQNHIEVWDIQNKQLCCVHTFKEEITSFAVVQHTFYMYIGDCHGNIVIFEFDKDQNNMIQMRYRIPFGETNAEEYLPGTKTAMDDDIAVTCILPQPTAEAIRVLIVYSNGLMILWGLSESRVLFVNGGNTQHISSLEFKRVTTACWACPTGSKVVIGYDSGDIFVWSIPADNRFFSEENKKELDGFPKIPIQKLNLGFKVEKIPVVSLKWTAGDKAMSRLYINGYSSDGHLHLFQVIILNDNNEFRMVKLVMPLSEPCLSMEIVSCFRQKHRQKALVLLLKSGYLCLYDDSQIEHYLLHCQSKASPDIPEGSVVKLPFGDSRITTAKLYSCQSYATSSVNEDYLLENKFPCLISYNKNEKDTTLPQFGEFKKAKHLYITGHHDGCINFWDASCPFLLPIFTLKQMAEDSNYSSAPAPVTVLHFNVSSKILLAGDQSGMVQLVAFKKEQCASDNFFSFLQAKQGSDYTIRMVKLNGAITAISMNTNSNHFAVGTAKGYFSIINTEGMTVMYNKHFPSQLYSGIVSLQFENISQNDFKKNVVVVGLEDSSVLALEEDTGYALGITPITTKKPRRALLVQILDSLRASSNGPSLSDFVGESKDIAVKDTSKSLLLVCSENDVRLLSLCHAIQGTKKIYGRKQLNGTCCAASLIRGRMLEVGILLVFASGRVEIRSLPDLSLLAETKIRGLPFLNLKAEPISEIALCASPEGEVIMANGDQEIFFFSTLLRDDIYRHLDSIGQVYKKGHTSPGEGNSPVTNDGNEKKKGIFSKVIKDLKGNKKSSPETTSVNFHVNTTEELSTIFSRTNFLEDDRKNETVQHEDVKLDIDDIDLEDTKEKSKGLNFAAVMNKQKLGNKLQAIKGKIIHKMDRKEDSSNVEHEEKSDVGSVDQIKRKYGYTMDKESTAPEIAKSKLNENVKKLESIGKSTSEMQDTAQSFASMAKDLLKAAKERKAF